MMRTLKLFATLCALALGVGDAAAVTKTASWTWPTTRTDGSTLALTSIGGATIYDTSVPVPGAPGTVVPCATALTFPPTTAAASCSVNVTGGHSFVLTISDNASPPDVSGNSNVVTVPLSVPSSVTNFTIQ